MAPGVAGSGPREDDGGEGLGCSTCGCVIRPHNVHLEALRTQPPPLFGVGLQGDQAPVLGRQPIPALLLASPGEVCQEPS